MSDDPQQFGTDGDRARARAVEISAMCNYFRCPEMAAGAIRSNATLAEVRMMLQQRRAADDSKQQPQPRSIDDELREVAERRFLAQWRGTDGTPTVTTDTTTCAAARA